MKKKMYKITNVRSRHWVKYQGEDSVDSVKAFFTAAGFKLSEFEATEHDAGVVLSVTRRGEDPNVIIVRETSDALAPISNYQQEDQTAIPGLTC